MSDNEMTRAGPPVRVFRSVAVMLHRIRLLHDQVVNGRHAGRMVYAALLALLIGSGWAALEHAESRAVRLFAADLATEALGLIVTVVMVHRFLERQERAQRLRGSLGALRRSGRALSAMVATWMELVKGTAERAPESRPTGLAEVLAPDLTAALAHIDTRSAVVGDAAMRLRDAREALRAVISTYGANLDPVYLGAIDDLTDDAFLALVTDADGLAAPAWAHGGVRSARAAHFERLLLAVECHNARSREAALLRDRRTAPRADGYSADLPLDADLRVADAVAPEWWSVAPRPGALRTVRFRDEAVPQADGSVASPPASTTDKALQEKEMSAPVGGVRGFPLRVAAQPL